MENEELMSDMSPGQEALCPCDWAEKTFSFSRWLRVFSELAAPRCSAQWYMQYLVLL